MKKLMTILLVWAFLAVPMAFAALATPTGVTQNSDETYTPTANNDIGNIQGGHIYNYTIDVEEQTSHWAGIYGTINQSVVLKDSAGNAFYTWSVTNPSYTVVYFSNNSSVDFAGQFIDLTGDSDLTTIGVWATTPSVETVTNTYKDTEAGTADANCGFADEGITGTEPNNWRYIILTDGSGDGDNWITCAAISDIGSTAGSVDSGDAILVAGNVDQDGGNAYDGTTGVHYEVLVPVESATPFYVWVA